MADISYLSLLYEDFQMLQVIDPDKFDKNFADIKSKVNEMVTALNASTNGLLAHKTSTDHDTRYYTKTQNDTNLLNQYNTLNGFIDAHKVSSEHDIRYYTKTEVNSSNNNLQVQINNNATALTVHQASLDHDSRYYIKSNIDDKFNAHKVSSDHDSLYYSKGEVDSKVVLTTTDQFIDGYKNFNKSPTAPAPISGSDLANKSYVDATIAGVTLGAIPDGSLTDEKFSNITGQIKDVGIRNRNDIISINALLPTKLDSSAYTASDVLTKIKTVDGAGSGLDADLLDGKNSTDFLALYNGGGNTAFVSGLDLNTITSTCLIYAQSPTNKPATVADGWCFTKTITGYPDWAHQEYISNTGTLMSYTRGKQSGVWSAWKEVATDKDTMKYVTSSNTADDPNTTFESAIVTNHSNSPDSNTYWYIISTFFSGKSSTNSRGQIAISYFPGSNKMYTRSYYNGSWSAWRTAYTDIGTATVPITGWVSTTGDYKYYYSLGITGVKSTDWVDVVVDREYIDIAKAAGMDCIVEFAGGVTFYSMSIPTVAIPIKYKITRG